MIDSGLDSACQSCQITTSGWSRVQLRLCPLAAISCRHSLWGGPVPQNQAVGWTCTTEPGCGVDRYHRTRLWVGPVPQNQAVGWTDTTEPGFGLDRYHGTTQAGRQAATKRMSPRTGRHLTFEGAVDNSLPIQSPRDQTVVKRSMHNSSSIADSGDAA